MCWISDYNQKYGCSPIEHEKERGISSFSDLELVTSMVGSRKAEKVLSMLSEKNFNFDGVVSDKDGFKIKAAFELGKRFGNHDKFKIESPFNMFSYLRHYSSHQQEHFIAIMFNGNNEVIDSKVITIGLLNRTVVHPREVFAPAIEMRAAAIAIAHNHPSGNLEPSDEDKATTDRLVEAGKILGIKVLDHLVFSTKGYYSFLEHGLI